MFALWIIGCSRKPHTSYVSFPPALAPQPTLHHVVRSGRIQSGLADIRAILEEPRTRSIVHKLSRSRPPRNSELIEVPLCIPLEKPSLRSTSLPQWWSKMRYRDNVDGSWRCSVRSTGAHQVARALKSTRCQFDREVWSRGSGPSHRKRPHLKLLTYTDDYRTHLPRDLTVALIRASNILDNVHGHCGYTVYGADVVVFASTDRLTVVWTSVISGKAVEGCSWSVRPWELSLGPCVFRGKHETTTVARQNRGRQQPHL